MTEEKAGSAQPAVHREQVSERFDNRPWGSFTVLDEGAGFKVKRIEVLPGKRLSYQYHAHRAEHWIVVKGTATVTLDGVESLVGEGEAMDVPVTCRHRIANGGSEALVLIEIQRGSYLGEDDIVRLDDDFQRISN